MAVDFDVRGHVATITLNPPEVMNALDPETLAALDGLWRKVREDDNVRSVVVTGAGDHAFCAGADLKKTMSPAEGSAQLTFGKDVGYGARLTSEKPINGIAVWGGLEVAVRCGLRIAVDTARLGLTEARVGRSVFPDSLVR